MIAGLVVTAGLMLAAGIEGKWTMEGAATKKAGPQKLTLNLKAAGAKLEGNIEGMDRKGAGVDIQNGKIDGAKFSFTTTVTNKKGDNKVVWEGTMEGDELKGTRMRDGGKKGQPFTAKRSAS